MPCIPGGALGAHGACAAVFIAAHLLLLGRVGCFDVSMCGGDEKAGCSRWAEGRRTLCPCNMEEEILEGRNLKDETFPQLFRANGFEASPRSALEVQSSRQESGWGGMSVLGWKLSFAASSAAVL